MSPSQIGSAVIILLLALATFHIIAPANECQRVGRTGNVVFITLGTIPKIVEVATGRSLDKYWLDIEKASAYVHNYVARYFGIANCEPPKYTFWGAHAGEGGTEKWLKEHDGELKSLSDKNAD